MAQTDKTHETTSEAPTRSVGVQRLVRCDCGWGGEFIDVCPYCGSMELAEWSGDKWFIDCVVSTPGKLDKVTRIFSFVQASTADEACKIARQRKGRNLPKSAKLNAYLCT